MTLTTDWSRNALLAAITAVSAAAITIDDFEHGDFHIESHAPSNNLGQGTHVAGLPQSSTIGGARGPSVLLWMGSAGSVATLELDTSTSGDHAVVLTVPPHSTATGGFLYSSLGGIDLTEGGNAAGLRFNFDTDPGNGTINVQTDSGASAAIPITGQGSYILPFSSFTGSPGALSSVNELYYDIIFSAGDAPIDVSLTKVETVADVDPTDPSHDIYWVGYQYDLGTFPIQGSFFDPISWLNFVVPTGEDNAIFGADRPMRNSNLAHNPHYLHFGNFNFYDQRQNRRFVPGGNATVDHLSLLGDQWVFDFGSGANPGATLPQPSFGSLTADSAAVDAGASLTIRNGTFRSTTIVISGAAGRNTSRVIVTGPGAEISVSAAMSVGDGQGGDGILAMESGGLVRVAQHLSVGRAGIVDLSGNPQKSGRLVVGGVAAPLVNGTARFGPDGTVTVNVYKSGRRVTSGLIRATRIEFSSNAILTLSLTGAPLVAGNFIQLFDAKNFSGSPILHLPGLGAGLAWDTSRIVIDGTLSVVSTRPLTGPARFE